MKNLLKKLHIMSNQTENCEGFTSSKTSTFSDGSSSEKLSGSQLHSDSEQKSFSGLSGWLNSVMDRGSPSPSPIPQSSSDVTRGEIVEQSDSVNDSALDDVTHDLETTNLRDPDITEEEYQIKRALKLSVQEDPEAAQIEAVKQISLDSCPPKNSPSEVTAFRYWNYNVLSYDDKILDGFYDLYGILMESASSNIPSLIDLQRTPVSENISWEAILVDRASDSKLLGLEEKALEMAVKSRSEYPNSVDTDLVKRLAVLVSDHMGGPVGDPEHMLIAWKSLSYNLKETLRSMVLPLGSLTIGLARHRALLFKVLADSVGIPCQLVKGQQYTGSIDVAMNFVRIHGAREYIVDLMADPGTLIPSDTAGSNAEYGKSMFSAHPLAADATMSSCLNSSYEQALEHQIPELRSSSSNVNAAGNKFDDKSELILSTSSILHNRAEEGCKRSSTSPGNVRNEVVNQIPRKSNYSYMHGRSPSWTEGVSSPAAQKMKVKDVSQYMIDAAKENPQLAQKLHDVLLESGVVAPRDLFTEIYQEPLNGQKKKQNVPSEKDERTKTRDELHDVLLESGGVAPPDLFTEIYQEQLNGQKKKQSVPSEKDKRTKTRDDALEIKGQGSRPLFLPPLPSHSPSAQRGHRGESEDQSDSKEIVGEKFSLQFDVAPKKHVRNVPVAAAAAAAAAVVASSMVVAAASTDTDTDPELPVAAAATATAAAVVATKAAVGKQPEVLDAHSPSAATGFNPLACERSNGDADATVSEPQGSGDQLPDALRRNCEGERISDRSTGNDSTRSDSSLDEALDCEIPWEDITLGERIGLGSYGEVYRGGWHGTDVAVKKFIDQELNGESLEEFRSEVRIMKRVRHPNVVLFMGAVTRPPNLSIVTEFLPRGSLYRLIHRPNNQLDVRRRMRMALDAARGMNYLHNCTPVIVHRDLKSPNLLVDKNWVVKVCDFGLSRMKYSTFLSSRSTAGTAEWMAPEVLRSEPSNEKCDVYSYGVILWELCTLKQPWEGMNPMQVVGAVGFQHRRLDIPDDMDPVIADIICKCWETDPKLRPSFSEIMAALKPLQKPITSSQAPRLRVSASSGQPS